MFQVCRKLRLDRCLIVAQLPVEIGAVWHNAPGAHGYPAHDEVMDLGQSVLVRIFEGSREFFVFVSERTLESLDGEIECPVEVSRASYTAPSRQCGTSMKERPRRTSRGPALWPATAWKPFKSDEERTRVGKVCTSRGGERDLPDEPNETLGGPEFTILDFIRTKLLDGSRLLRVSFEAGVEFLVWKPMSVLETRRRHTKAGLEDAHEGF